MGITSGTQSLMSYVRPNSTMQAGRVLNASIFPEFQAKKKSENPPKTNRSPFLSIGGVYLLKTEVFVYIRMYMNFISLLLCSSFRELDRIAVGRLI